MADTEEEYLTHDDETEAERTRRKANKRKAMSRFNEELRQQGDDEAQTVRELNRRSADNSRAKHSRRAEQSPEVIQEERIQAREISSA